MQSTFESDPRDMLWTEKFQFAPYSVWGFSAQVFGPFIFVFLFVYMYSSLRSTDVTVTDLRL